MCRVKGIMTGYHSHLGDRIGKMVSFLAFLLPLGPRFNPARALHGLGFQSLLDCVGFPWIILRCFPTS